MIYIKKILRENGVEGELVDTIADTIKAEIPKDFVSKAQYNKKVATIDGLNETIADLEAKAESLNTDEYKEKYEALEGEYNAYKNDIENKEINKTKTETLMNKLKGEGANEKLVNLLLKEFDLNKVELEDGEVKGWEDLVKPVKENYSDCFAVVETVGTPPATPPKGAEIKNDPFLEGFGI